MAGWMEPQQVRLPRCCQTVDARRAEGSPAAGLTSGQAATSCLALSALQIIIVDEFTGRTMPGRRWSDGLHQVR